MTRYVVIKTFTDHQGTTWQPGDQYPQVDDPQEWVDAGCLQDATKPPVETGAPEDEGSELARRAIENRGGDYHEERAKAEAEAKAEGRDLDKEQRARAHADARKDEKTGSETHAKAHDDKSGESDTHRGTRAKR